MNGYVMKPICKGNSSSVDKFRTLLCTRDDAIESELKKKLSLTPLRIDMLKAWNGTYPVVYPE